MKFVVFTLALLAIVVAGCVARWDVGKGEIDIRKPDQVTSGG